MLRMKANVRFICMVMVVVVALISGSGGAAWASPIGGRHLETPATYCDAVGFSQFLEPSVIVDSRDGRIQAVGSLHEGPFQGSADEAAWEFLKRHADWVGVEPTKENLKIVRSVSSPGGLHVTFDRHIGGISVYPGNLVVTFDHAMFARFFANGLYTFKEHVETSTILDKESAKQIAVDYISPKGKLVYEADMELMVWAGDNRDFALCWQYWGNHTDPYGDWQVLVDARTGEIRRVRDRAMGMDGTGQVFDPDPLTTSGMPYGSDFLVDDNDENNVWLSSWRVPVTLYDISDLVLYGNHFFSLAGPYARSMDYELPNITPVLQVNNTNFDYTRDNEYFEEVMCYYHIDKSQRWIQSLGFTNVVNTQFEYDAHAEDYDCNAHHHSSGPDGGYLTFGDGDPAVDAAEDAEVIWHEYGHAINHSIMPWWGGSGDENAMGEGWGDYWAGSYGRSIATYHSSLFAGWGLKTCFAGRTLLEGLHYPEDAGDPDPHYSGKIWSQALYVAEVQINDRAIMNKISLEHQYLISSGSTMPMAALALIEADQMLYNGRYSVHISDACVWRGILSRPLNDTCPGYSITELPYTHQTSTATADNNYPNCAGTTSPDIVYTLRLPCPHLVTVSLCGLPLDSSYDSGLEIRTGDVCPGTTQVECGDDGCGANNRQSTVDFVAAGGTDYYIIVHGYLTYSGAVVVSVTGTPLVLPPPNETCPGTQISALPFTDYASTCSAVNNHANCVNSSSADVFYTMNLSSCYSVTVSLCDANFDTGLEVRMGGACPGSASVACNDDYCGTRSQAQFAATAHENYYIIVHGYGNARGNATVEVTGTPYVAGNDTCPGTYILSLPYSDFGNTYCADSDWDKCGSSLSRDVVYRYQSISCQTLSASLCGSSFDTQLEVRRGGSCPGSIQVGCSDDYCGLQSFLEFPSTEGETYYFLVHGYGSGAGAYQFQLSGTLGGLQTNDDCAGAIPVLSLPYQDQGSTNCATNSRANCIGSESNEVFYRLNVESCTEVLASLCYSDYDTGIEVRTDGACPGTTLVACNDDNIGCNPEGSLQSMVQFVAEPNTDYFLIVHGFSDNAGVYRLEILGTTCAPESLTIQRSGDDAFLDWSAVSASSSVTYFVYRDISPDILLLPQNLIATTSNTFYSDAGAVLNPQSAYFYVVTASAPTLLSETPPNAEALVSPVNEKQVSVRELEEMRSRVIPAYVDSANICAPNPSKETRSEDSFKR